MPEYPDIENYVDALKERIVGCSLLRWQFLHPFILRTVEPPADRFIGEVVSGVERQEKRIVISFEHDLYASIHLMIAGRLHWKDETKRGGTTGGQKRPAAKGGTLFEAAFRCTQQGSGTSGILRLTEAGSRRRAAIHLVQGRAALLDLRRGGLELFSATVEEFAARLRSRNHTVKRALTDPQILSGVGNSYSDEILHAAKMSPFLQTAKMSNEELARLFDVARETLRLWRDRLTTERSGAFPSKVTAFHPAMSVHGKFGQPCPQCGTHVQKIQYAENECNYCPLCQTGGIVYADRALSRLLKGDWPRTVEELENTPGLRY